MLKIKIVRSHSPWQAFAALACFVTAVMASVAGSLLTAEWILNAQLHPWLHTIGLILLVLALPILILGGHCLDLMELREKAGRKDVRRQMREGSRRLHVGVIGLLCLFFISPSTVSAQQLSGQVAVLKVVRT